MTTQILVSSTWTPTPLAFALELPRVRMAGRMKSPAAVLFNSGRYCSTPLEVGAEVAAGAMIVGAVLRGVLGSGREDRSSDAAVQVRNL